MTVRNTQDLVSTVESAEQGGHLSASAAVNITQWLTDPWYSAFVPEIIRLIDAGNWKQLDDVFWTIIPFGTGGRRGMMYPVGSNAINDRTIGESAQGVATYVKKYVEQRDGIQRQPVCAIGWDTRHKSRHFAELCASIMAANGFKVWFLEDFRSTPEISFLVRYKHCDCGIMVTASHNPPSDNAVKVYWSTGGQLLPPYDKDIIDCVMNTQSIHIANFDTELAAAQIEYCERETDAEFLAAVLKQSHSGPRDIRILYSPLHGVGATCVLPALAGAGFKDVELYAPHSQPDGDFPNVPNHVANPENPQVFDAMIEYAKANDFDLILATDPDSDRMGCAAPLKIDDKTGPWAVLTGNQIATLLAEYQLNRTFNGPVPPEYPAEKYYIVKTLVTTDLIRKLTQSYGATLVGDLLVGFKYIGGAIDDCGPEGFLLGAEESYGYLIGTHCRDKDAAVASMVFSELAAAAKAEGLSIHQKLAAIFQQFGVHQERTVSAVMPGSQGMARMREVMAVLRENPPAEIAGMAVIRTKDYLNQVIRMAGGETTSLTGPKGDLVILELEQPGNYVAVRPSGTEPKVKFYMFTCLPPEQSQDVPVAVTNLQQRLDAMETSLREFALGN